LATTRRIAGDASGALAGGGGTIGGATGRGR
jgi:hypothetical protein